MATSAPQDENAPGNKEDSKFECNICFETAKDAVVSLCGHLFCWPCIHTWMETRPNSTPTCPVCKSVIDKERLIPLYGRGSTGQQDPREKVPPRPQGQREEAPDDNQGFYGQGFNMGGVNISFGVGGFPFGFGLGPTFTFQTGQGGPFDIRQTGAGIRRPRQGAPGQTEEQRKMMARLMLTFAILFIVMIIFT